MGGSDDANSIRGGDIMSLDDFNTKFNDSETFDDEPTSVLQQIADKPFTIVKVKAGISKSGNQYCIVWTDEKYLAGVNVADEGQEARYENQKVEKWFVIVREPKQFFTDPTNIEKINGGKKCGPLILTKKKFTVEEIAANKKLAGKSHYILRDA